MALYEFKLFSDGVLIAVHSAECISDEGARDRASAYLDACTAFDTVIVRCGARFQRKVQAPHDINPPATEGFWLM